MESRAQIILKCTPSWVVAVDMGYGHQRPAHALGCLAYGGKVINANNYKGIPERDRKIWHESRRFYEWVSKFKKVPIVGPLAWSAFDRVQQIKPFYPKRDLSEPNLQLRSIYHYIGQGWGKDLIDKLNTKDIPLITTFFAVAFMAEEHGFRNDIYCVVTDTDVSRSWVPQSPHLTKIKYFCPNRRTVERLKLYGVPAGNIFLTGFPLPLENIGEDQGVLKSDLLDRLVNLDPNKRYLQKYRHMIEYVLGTSDFEYAVRRPLHITFAVGGAGAQRDIGVAIARSLRYDLLQERLQLTLVAGIHNNVSGYFKSQLKALGLGKKIGKNIFILHAPTKEEYFKEFDATMRVTDILWTKPSELSFYSALGIPIIMAPPIGSQEEFNKRWLKTVGAGITQDDPRYVNEWLWEWLESGWLAEAAMEGFIDAPKYGTYNIGQIISLKPEQVHKESYILQF